MLNKKLTQEQAFYSFLMCYILAYYLAVSQCVNFRSDSESYEPYQPLEFPPVVQRDATPECPPVVRKNSDTPMVTGDSLNVPQDRHGENLTDTPLISDNVKEEPKENPLSVSSQASLEPKEDVISDQPQPALEQKGDTIPASSQPDLEPKGDVNPVPAQPTEEGQKNPDNSVSQRYIRLLGSANIFSFFQGRV